MTAESGGFVFVRSEAFGLLFSVAGCVRRHVKNMDISVVCKNFLQPVNFKRLVQISKLVGADWSKLSSLLFNILQKSNEIYKQYKNLTFLKSFEVIFPFLVKS